MGQMQLRESYKLIFYDNKFTFFIFFHYIYTCVLLTLECRFLKPWQERGYRRSVVTTVVAVLDLRRLIRAFPFHFSPRNAVAIAYCSLAIARPFAGGPGNIKTIKNRLLSLFVLEILSLFTHCFRLHRNVDTSPRPKFCSLFKLSGKSNF